MSFFILEYKEEDTILPRIRIEFDSNAHITAVALSGWKVSNAISLLGDGQLDTLYNVLCEAERLTLCQGIEKQIKGSLEHPQLVWDGKKIETSNIIRSSKCNIIVSSLRDVPVCVECSKYANVQDVQSQVEVDNQIHETIKVVYGEEEKSLNNWHKMFYKNQISNASLSIHARRYHPDVVRWALELYCRSPAAYEHIRSSKALVLPSISTIKSYRNCIPPTSGISSIALAEIERVAKDKEELIGYLTLDEMKIRENVVIRDGMLVGFSELQPLSDKPSLASHILVFYVRTVKREVSIPLAWYPTNVTPAYQMAIIFWELLNECEKRGLQIHAVVADDHKKFSLVLETRWYKVYEHERL
ncbi:uncharacterized protein LOC144745216 isoform X2 [Ciona intestinalis]